ncbi:MAG: hypothetical protein JRE64_26390, partial [Deltaproteobacteria bacterium]|nr:hypothetical protein [Deltaproteobacteria bacterium]
MNQTEVNRFKKLYQRHLRLLKLQGKSQKTIDAYSRAVRRVGEHFDCCPDKLIPEQLLRRIGVTHRLPSKLGQLCLSSTWGLISKTGVPSCMSSP